MSVSINLLIAIIETRRVDVNVSTSLLITIIETHYVDIDVRLSINTSTKRAIVDYNANKEVKILIKEIAKSIIAFV